MKRLFSALLLLAACSRPEPVPPGFSAYEDPGKLFAVAAPSDWRVMEGTGGAQRVSFFGPPAGPKPYSASIAVYHHPKGSEYASPEEYAARHRNPGDAPPVEATHRGGKVLLLDSNLRRPALHGRPAQELRERTALVPAKDGFFALVLSADAASYEKTEPLFSAFLDSFR